MSTIQDTIGRLAIAKENVTMAQKTVSQILHVFFEREDVGRAKAPPPPSMAPAVVMQQDIHFAIERLELAIHDLKIIRERIQDDAARESST